MKLHEQTATRVNLIARYGGGNFQVNGRTLSDPAIVAPGFLLAEWIGAANELGAGSLAPLWPLEPRIVLLGGTGFSPHQLHELRTVLTPRQIALECMDLGAACRTYNVLAQEERAVVALLFPA